MDIHKIFDVINYVGEITSSSKVIATVFIELAISLLIMFGLRVILIFKTAGIKFIKEEKYKMQKGIILNHIGIEIIIALIISFLLLLMIKTTSNNLIINMIVAPLLGQIVAIFIDDKWFAQKDYESIYGGKDKKSAHSLADLIGIPGDITQEMIDSEDFKPIVAQTINQIRDKQDKQEHKIDSTIEMLSKLLESEKNEKRVLLKKQMYDCLAKGFITPSEREKIESEYNDYRELLNGNHDVQHLYENHFSKLGVHEDRRKQDVKVDNDRRQQKRNCEYGQFDKEENP